MSSEIEQKIQSLIQEALCAEQGNLWLDLVSSSHAKRLAPLIRALDQSIREYKLVTSPSEVKNPRISKSGEEPEHARFAEEDARESRTISYPAAISQRVQVVLEQFRTGKMPQFYHSYTNLSVLYADLDRKAEELVRAHLIDRAAETEVNVTGDEVERAARIRSVTMSVAHSNKLNPLRAISGSFRFNQFRDCFEQHQGRMELNRVFSHEIRALTESQAWMLPLLLDAPPFQTGHDSQFSTERFKEGSLEKALRRLVEEASHPKPEPLLECSTLGLSVLHTLAVNDVALAARIYSCERDRRKKRKELLRLKQNKQHALHLQVDESDALGDVILTIYNYGDLPGILDKAIFRLVYLVIKYDEAANTRSSFDRLRLSDVMTCLAYAITISARSNYTAISQQRHNELRPARALLRQTAAQTLGLAYSVLFPVSSAIDSEQKELHESEDMWASQQLRKEVLPNLIRALGYDGPVGFEADEALVQEAERERERLYREYTVESCKRLEALQSKLASQSVGMLHQAVVRPMRALLYTLSQSLSPEEPVSTTEPGAEANSPWSLSESYCDSRRLFRHLLDFPETATRNTLINLSLDIDATMGMKEDCVDFAFKPDDAIGVESTYICMLDACGLDVESRPLYASWYGSPSVEDEPEANTPDTSEFDRSNTHESLDKLIHEHRTEPSGQPKDVTELPVSSPMKSATLPQAQLAKETKSTSVTPQTESWMMNNDLPPPLDDEFSLDPDELLGETDFDLPGPPIDWKAFGLEVHEDKTVSFIDSAISANPSTGALPAAAAAAASPIQSQVQIVKTVKILSEAEEADRMRRALYGFKDE